MHLINTVNELSTGVGTMLVSYGVYRYVGGLTLDSCTDWNLRLGLAGLAVSGVTSTVLALRQ